MTLRVGPADRLEAELDSRRGDVLMAVRYGGPTSGLRRADPPVLDVPNPVLDGVPRVEIWGTPAHASTFRRGDLAWSEDGRVLFGCRCRRVGDDIEAAAFGTYRELLALLAERGYPGLQRVWNYVPRINEAQRGIESYRRFNIGRARGFEEAFGATADRHFPAASAVGTVGDTLIVCFAAGREPGTHLENPRQTRAPRYPPDYGPRSPSFARGTFAPASWGETLFLSGTASVVGHETRHHGDPLGQLEESLTNIEILLDEAVARSGWRRHHVVGFGLLKTYVRSPEHFPAIRDRLARRLDPSTPVLYLQADLCRSDLLVEIEGVSL